MAELGQNAPTDATDLISLWRAVEERTVAAAAGRATGLAIPKSSPVPHALSAGELVRLRTAICGLASYYVDIDRTDYINDRWASFPATFGSKAPLQGDHSLCELPAAGAFEASPPTLHSFRRFVANASWWLKRFRFVAAAEAYWEQRMDAHGSEWHSLYNPYGGDSSTGNSDSTIAGILANPTVTDQKVSAASVNFCDFIEEARRSSHILRTHLVTGATEEQAREDGASVVYSTIASPFLESETNTRTVTAMQRVGLVVPNPTGLSAALRLYFTRKPGSYERPYDIETRGLHKKTSYETMSVGAMWDSAGHLIRISPADAYAWESLETVSEKKWTGSGWKEIYSRSASGTRTKTDNGWVSDGSRRTVETLWSADGRESFVESDETEPYTPPPNTGGNVESSSIDVAEFRFDSFGLSDLGEYQHFLVLPHEAIRLFSEQAFRLPTSFGSLSARLGSVEQLESTDEEIRRQSTLRLVPIFDFGPSFHHLPPA